MKLSLLLGVLIVATSANADSFSGLYRTSPTEISYSAKLRSGTQVSALGDLSSSKEWFMSIIHDPQAIAQDSEDATKVDFFTDLAAGTGFRINRSGPLTFSADLSYQTTAITADCSEVDDYRFFGSVVRESGLPSVDDRPISGRTQITAQRFFFFDEKSPGSCAAAQAAIEICFLDMNTCSGATAMDRQALHDYYVTVFQNGVNAGALNPNQIHNLEYTGYTIQYQ